VSDHVLVIDVGTSSVRAAVVDSDAHVVLERALPLLPDSPAPGLVEFDATVMARTALELASEVAAPTGAVAAVGVANQRGSTVVWDRATGEPVAPGLGWQDLRTVGRCLELRADGVRVAPNLSATKAEAILDAVDPDRSRDLCVGTVDSWLAWSLTGGALHVTDGSNALVTGLRTGDNAGWDGDLLERLRIPERSLPTVVDSSAVLGNASALHGGPPLTALLGDQQASLLGQACVRMGDAKITFGTGAMLDVVLDTPPAFTERGGAGTYPIVTRRLAGADSWGIEAIMLSAGSNVEWLRDDLGIIADAAETDRVAATCTDTGDVWYVPALLGLGTPAWDYGARGALLGLTRGTDRAHVVRAVLEGVAHRAADLLDAAEQDAALTVEVLRADGGMTENATFVQAVADATQRPIEIAPAREATALGAAFAAGLAIGCWSDDDAIAACWRPARRVEPGASLDRERWAAAVERARRWYPELSALDV
jgi:glycerol kinase